MSRQSLDQEGGISVRINSMLRNAAMAAVFGLCALAVAGPDVLAQSQPAQQQQQQPVRAARQQDRPARTGPGPGPGPEGRGDCQARCLEGPVRKRAAAGRRPAGPAAQLRHGAVGRRARRTRRSISRLVLVKSKQGDKTITTCASSPRSASSCRPASPSRSTATPWAACPSPAACRRSAWPSPRPRRRRWRSCKQGRQRQFHHLRGARHRPADETVARRLLRGARRRSTSL